MGQERMAGLALMHVHRAIKIDGTEVIKNGCLQEEIREGCN